MTNLGADFKKARESKGISLDQIATETRIRIRFLTAIELNITPNNLKDFIGYRTKSFSPPFQGGEPGVPRLL